MREGSKTRKEDCAGCEDDFYNGNNNLGVNECWCFESALLTFKQKIPIDERPPHKQKPILVPNCYRKRGFVFWSKLK